MIHFGYKWLKKTYFDKGNVIVVGLRGTGKDTTFSGVTSLCDGYISNTDYKHTKSKYNYLDINKLNINNTYHNFITNDINYYEYPYEEKQDIFIADLGAYFPSQYSSDLDKKYGSFAIFQALSRHLGACNIHGNCQNLNRIWNKLREQADIYLKCLKTTSIGRLVITRYRYYENYDSCVNNVKPFRMVKPKLTDRNSVTQYNIYKDGYINTHGVIKDFTIIAIRKGNYDTRIFKTMLLNGKKKGSDMNGK